MRRNDAGSHGVPPPASRSHPSSFLRARDELFPAADSPSQQDDLRVIDMLDVVDPLGQIMVKPVNKPVRTPDFLPAASSKTLFPVPLLLRILFSCSFLTNDMVDAWAENVLRSSRSHPA